MQTNVECYRKQFNIPFTHANHFEIWTRLIENTECTHDHTHKTPKLFALRLRALSLLIICYLQWSSNQTCLRMLYLPGALQPAAVQGRARHLVVESAPVHHGADGDEGSQGPLVRAVSESRRAQRQHVLHARRVRHHHLHHHARRALPRPTDAAYLQVRPH